MRDLDFFEELSKSNSIPELTAECGVMSSGEILDSSRGLGILIAFVWTYKLLLFFYGGFRDNFVNLLVAVSCSAFSIFQNYVIRNYNN